MVTVLVTAPAAPVYPSVIVTGAPAATTCGVADTSAARLTFAAMTVIDQTCSE